MTDIHAKMLEDKLHRSLRAKIRFKALVRQVIHNLAWLTLDSDEIDIHNLPKNVPFAKRNLNLSKGLSIKEKAMLRKPADFRTEEERQHLYKFIGGLKCFRRYPMDVQYELVGETYFEYYDAGRVLVRENQEAHAMYFLLSGVVIISQDMFDEVSNEWITTEVGKMSEGTFFGEVSLLHDVRRTATVTTFTPCELLSLKKSDFDRILKETVKQQWAEMQKAMAKISYFDGWDNVATRECCLLAKLKNYEANQVIFGDGVKKSVPAMMYFIIEGKCSVIEHFFIMETIKNGKKYYTLFENQKTLQKFAAEHNIWDINSEHPEGYTEPTLNKLSRKSKKNVKKQIPNSFLPPNCKIRFMQVGLLGKQAVFQEGPFLKNRRVLALTRVTCLLVPCFWLIQQNKADMWGRVNNFLKARIPTTEVAFKSFVDQKKWLEYRRKVRDTVLNKRKFPNNTTIYDVPYSIRILYDN